MNKKLEDKVSQNKNTILSLKEKLENEISSNTSSNSDDSDSDEKTCLKPLIDVKNLDNLEENSNKDLSDDSDSDDEELLREYEKIQQAKKEQERRKEIEESNKVKDRTEEEILSGNPIYAQDYFLKKRWYEDTVFKNQARTNKVDNQFINDTIRSDFFKKFIDKSIK